AIKTVSAVDKDEMAHRQHFHFSLSPKVANNHNFSLKDNRASSYHRGQIKVSGELDVLLTSYGED
ncbi:cadherin-11, partial [Tachysurus ichikawai]